MIQGGDELVAFVLEKVGFVALRDGLCYVSIFPALSLVGVQDLKKQRKKVIRNSDAGSFWMLRRPRMFVYVQSQN